jgi:hypothetical protein
MAASRCAEWCELDVLRHVPCGAIDFGKADIVLPASRLAGALQMIAEEWASSANA